jgi:hypothetical protein
MGSDPPIPDASKWVPRDASETLSSVFAAECNGAEDRLLQGLRREKSFAIDNFDSGLPFEGLVRDELRLLLPHRYSVTSGLVLDRHGKTGGKCDTIIFNDQWFSPVKSPASKESGTTYVPIEGVYAVGEIKQTLSSSILDAAMEKLVKFHRLHRPRTFANRLVENRENGSCPHGLTNPLFSFILAGSVFGDSFLYLVERFLEISKQLKRLELVHALCVLGEGTMTWAFRDPLRDDEVRPALFVKDDLFHPIFPSVSPTSYRGAFLNFMQMLQVNLFHTVLGPEDLAYAYSRDNGGIKLPKDPKIAHPPDKEWIELGGKPCKDSNHKP